MNAKEYVLKNFDRSIIEQKEDVGNFFGLPYPYTSPCAKGGHFSSLFYHDTFYINVGMIAEGRVEVALNNVNDIAYLINLLGYMPNASNKGMLGRSQPPYFAMMVKDVFDETGDIIWLKEMIPVMEKEQEFWNNKRKTENGLNRHFGDYTKEQYESFAKYVKGRVKIDPSREDEEVGMHYFAEAESGWDFTARFNGVCADYNPVDLQCILYFAENFISDACKIVGDNEKSLIWQNKANERKEKVNTLNFDKGKGIYTDYNYKTGELTKIYSSAGFFPYLVGVAQEGQRDGALKLLELLESEYGVSSTIKTEEKYQWGYENAWAPIQFVAVASLNKCGYEKQAKRVAQKYVDMVERNFDKTGKLFEKYNVLTGGTDAVSEYGTPEMLGWTASVYLYCKKFLEN